MDCPPLQPGMREFGTPQECEEYRAGGCGVILDPKTQRYAVYRTTDGLSGLFAGGVDEDEDIQEGILREIREESGLYDFGEVEVLAEARAHYYNRQKDVYRVADATCLLIKLKSNATQAQQLEAHEDFTLDWMTHEEIIANWDEHNAQAGREHWVWFLQKADARVKELGWG